MKRISETKELSSPDPLDLADNPIAESAQKRRGGPNRK
jgi:hypothetical protein